MYLYEDIRLAYALFYLACSYGVSVLVLIPGCFSATVFYGRGWGQPLFRGVGFFVLLSSLFRAVSAPLTKLRCE